MRIREVVFGSLLMSVTLSQVGSQLAARPLGVDDTRGSPDTHSVVPIPAPSSSLILKDRVLTTAYYDAMEILSVGNRCSAFFGGARPSVEVFSQFMAEIKREHLTHNIGMRMYGDYVTVTNARTNLRYRLFNKVTVNSNGPFYRSTSDALTKISDVGSFQANTREGRVLMLLHELGHLMRENSKWLLPDDGEDLTESIANTKKIETVCGDQIRELGKNDSTQNLLTLSSSTQSVSPMTGNSKPAMTATEEIEEGRK